ncbi:MAG TPA: MFS transporter, partial [Phycisphaerae bacterium]|nr:MFS transporter [Phycisphaerae bacterium]
TPLQTGEIGGVALFGQLVGSFFGGYISDLWGRKAIYLLDLATFFVAALLCAGAWSFLSLYIFRFILGIGIGADYPLSATYMAEFMPANRRGGIITWTFGLWPVGAIVAGLVGYLLLRIAGAEAWRWMFAIGALPALFVLYLRRDLPESPRWYLRRNDPDSAAAVLKRMVPELTQPQIDAMIETQRAIIVQRPKILPAELFNWRYLRSNIFILLPWFKLFNKRYLRSTLLVCVPWFLMDVAGYFIVIYKPQLLSHLGYKTHESQILWSAIINFAYPFGFIPLALLVDKIGRIWPQIIGFVGGALALVFVVFAGDSHPEIAFLGLLFNNFALGFGPGSTTYILPSEVYPTDVRATGHGFATAFSRVGAWLSATYCLPLAVWLGTASNPVRLLSAHLYPPLEALSGLGYLLCILAIVYLAGAVTTWIFRVQTASKPLIEEEHLHPGPGPSLQPVPEYVSQGSDEIS